MNQQQMVYFRDQLRAARATALADSEGFSSAVHAIEALGKQLLLDCCGKNSAARTHGLRGYANCLSALAAQSPLARAAPNKHPSWHTNFWALLDEFTQARNDAVHQGTYARTLANHAVQLTLILEDALMLTLKDGSAPKTISQFMVRDVITADDWHPLSYIRQQMLQNAFSFLPHFRNGTWHLIADYAIAKYLRSEDREKISKVRLLETLKEATDQNQDLLVAAVVKAPNLLLTEFPYGVESKPILITDPKYESRLLGLMTVSDIL